MPASISGNHPTNSIRVLPIDIPELVVECLEDAIQKVQSDFTPAASLRLHHHLTPERGDQFCFTRDVTDNASDVITPVHSRQRLHTVAAQDADVKFVGCPKLRFKLEQLEKYRYFKGGLDD